jgi:hypothetical protein
MAAVAPATESGRWFSEGSGGTTKPHSDFEHRTTEEMKADARLVVFFKNFTANQRQVPEGGHPYVAPEGAPPRRNRFCALL